MPGDPARDLNAVLRDTARLARLRQLNLLDTPGEIAFDRLSRLASRNLHTPVALVTLIDEDRQFFKSCLGLPEPWQSWRQTPLSHSFCQHVVATGAPLIINDSRVHPLLRDNAAILDLSVIAYLGIPLVLADGTILGSFCVIDSKPRQWSTEEVEILKDFTALVIDEIDLRDQFAKRKLAEELLRDTNAELKRLADDQSVAISKITTDLREENRRLKATQNYARESDEFHRQIISSAQEGIIVLDRDLRYVTWNAFMEQLTGMPAKDVVGKTPMELFPFLEEQGMILLINRALAGESLRAPDISAVLPHTGKTVWTSGYLNPLRNSSGEIIGVIALVRDITERKRLQEHLNQAQKMEGVGRVAGGVAHDFNNLLTAILGSTDLAILELPPDAPVKVHLAQIRQATERGAALTGQLLAFARKQPITPKIVNLNDLLKQVEQLLRKISGERVEMTIKLAADLGNVSIDATQFEQVLFNLVLNAREAMPDGGRLTIETCNVLLDEKQLQTPVVIGRGECVMLAVSDSGIGIAPEVMRHIFEPFFTTKPEGTGLGLATSYGIVKQNNGHIWAYSEPGKGSTFKVYLPRIDKPVDKQPEAANPFRACKNNQTVLLVEDETMLRSIIAQTLELAGCQVLQASDGEEALTIAAKHTDIGLLITDVMMPKMGGSDLANELSRTLPTLKVLFISGYTENALMHHGAVGIGRAFLQKPFSPVALANKIHELLGS